MDKEKQLFKAANFGNLNVVMLLLRDHGANIHANEDYALRLAAKNGHYEVVKFLVDNDANIHAEKEQALRLAAESGHTEVIKLLIANGADIHAQNDYAFRWAVHNNHSEIVELLLGYDGANIRAESKNKALPLVVKNGHYKIAKLLLKNGADLEALNSCTVEQLINLLGELL